MRPITPSPKPEVETTMLDATKALGAEPGDFLKTSISLSYCTDMRSVSQHTFVEEEKRVIKGDITTAHLEASWACFGPTAR